MGNGNDSILPVNTTAMASGGPVTVPRGMKMSEIAPELQLGGNQKLLSMLMQNMKNVTDAKPPPAQMPIQAPQLAAMPMMSGPVGGVGRGGGGMPAQIPQMMQLSPQQIQSAVEILKRRMGGLQ